MALELGVHFRIFVCVVSMGLLVGFVFNAKSDVTDNEYIDAVKNGYVGDLTYVNVSNAFNRYFDEPYWRYYEARKGQHVVELSGKTIVEGDEGHAILQFVVEDGSKDFKIGALKFNDRVVEMEEKWGLVNAVYLAWEESQMVMN